MAALAPGLLPAPFLVALGRGEVIKYLSLDPMAQALAGTALRSVDCLGCGRCVEACPTGNLALETRLGGRVLGPDPVS